MTTSNLFIVINACILTFINATSRAGTRSLIYGNDVEHVCMPLQIDICEDVLPYNETFVPNLLLQKTQEEAKLALFGFQPLINYNCSDTLKQLLCFIYAPPCTNTAGPVPVCKSLCEKAFTPECREIMKKVSIHSMVLDCSKYPTSGLCITPDQVSSGSGRNVEGGKDVTPLNPFINKGPDSYYSESGSAETIDPHLELDLLVLVTSGPEIQLIDIQGSMAVDTISLHRRMESENNPAIGLYLPEQYIYWASTVDARICRGTLENDQMYNIRRLIDTGTAVVTSIAVDWNLKVLFWSEILATPGPQIRTSSLSGRGVTTVLDRNLTHPMSLALDPSEGKIFWIDKKGNLRNPKATIESYSIVTQTRTLIRTIMPHHMLPGARPCALITDIEEKRLYWVDSGAKSLHSMNYDGTEHEIVLQDSERLNDLENLVVKGDYLYWMDGNALMRVNKRNGSDELLIKVFERNPPQSMKLFEEIADDTSNYDRDALDKTWRELSSSESMEDKPIYDDDDDYNDDYDSSQRKRNKNRNKTSLAHRVVIDTFLIIAIVLFSSIVRSLV